MIFYIFNLGDENNSKLQITSYKNRNRKFQTIEMKIIVYSKFFEVEKMKILRIS